MNGNLINTNIMKRILLLGIALFITMVVSAQRTYNTTRLTSGVADWETSEMMNKQTIEANIKIIVDSSYNVKIVTDTEVFQYYYVLGSHTYLSNGEAYNLIRNNEEYYVICNDVVFILIDVKDNALLFR